MPDVASALQGLMMLVCAAAGVVYVLYMFEVRAEPAGRPEGATNRTRRAPVLLSRSPRTASSRFIRPRWSLVLATALVFTACDSPDADLFDDASPLPMTP